LSKVKFWVGITDREWFEFLSVREPDEVNFWQPSEKPLASFLSAGSPFLFKLHHPENFIVGGGFFVRFTSLPVWLAWSAFGPKNGVPDQAQLISRLLKYRRGSDARTAIGCNVLAQPFFFPREHWISVPTDWQINIVRGKTYDTESPLGHALWSRIGWIALPVRCRSVK
jgi:putative restriction endonuclease